ncbi:MAG TPA: universal stress protein [Ramlibacter sp.]|nr:universal stress protein [Ramlibacter sp.]
MLAQAGIAHDIHRLTGDAAPGIAAFAAEHGSEAIAMASHGGGLLRHAFGSVALRTAHLSEVPVMLMR